MRNLESISYLLQTGMPLTNRMGVYMGLNKKYGEVVYVGKSKDYWKRTLAECFIKNESISSYMVKNGYACDYVKYSKGKYAKEQKHAKSNKLGIWKMKFNPAWEKKCG